MGAVGGLLGLGGGAAGSSFNTLSPAALQQPTTSAQAQTAYTANQNALKQQQDLVNALQGQNGIQNQSNVYNQLQGIANGTGPNPAQAMLNQATGANVANQAALMAGQRGASQNVGLIARQAAQQGANTQQQAAGQGATMQAQQSLGALGQLQGLSTNQANQQIGATQNLTTQQQAEQQNLLNAIAQQNQANVGINSANAGLANTQMQGQQGLLGGLMNAAGPAIGAAGNWLFGGGAGAALGSVGTGAGELAGGAGDAIGGASAADAAPLALAAKGGKVQSYDDGGYVQQSVDYNNQDPVSYGSGATDMSTVNPRATSSSAQPSPGAPGATSSFGKFVNSISPSERAKNTPSNKSAQQTQAKPSDFNYGNTGANKLAAGVSNAMSDIFTPSNMNPNNQSQTVNMAKGGKVPAMVSPGEKYIPPKEVKKIEKGEKSPMEAGKIIPGKPKVKGAKDSYANDTVPKTLEEGGIVLPRSVTQSKNPHWEAKKFVEAIMAKKQGLKKGLK
jgi:hypothetical protein